MNSTVIYHNPRCSKSRQTLQLLRDRQIEPEIIEYLQHPPSPAELSRILELLKMTPQEIIRRGEEAFKALPADSQSYTDAQWIDIICQQPKLLQRPIVIHQHKAAIGRPPENILEIL